jgi:hypothetical protein
MRILERWKSSDENDPIHDILLDLVPGALNHLSGLSDWEEVLPVCMELLRREQKLTPHVAAYLRYIPNDGRQNVLNAFSGLLDANAYLTPWQALWLQTPLAEYGQVLAGDGSQSLRDWLRTTFQSRAGEVVRTTVAYTLARHNAITMEEILSTYDEVSMTSKPVLSAALGALGASTSQHRVRSITGEDELHQWIYEWAVANNG